MTKTDAFQKAAETLAEAFTSPTGDRNPDWDIDKPDDPVSNPYHLPRFMEERIQDGAVTTFTDTDGHTSIRVISIAEIVQVLADAGLLVDPSKNEVFEIYDKLSRQRLNEVIYDKAQDALDVLANANVDPRQYIVRSIRFERDARP